MNEIGGGFCCYHDCDCAHQTDRDSDVSRERTRRLGMTHVVPHGRALVSSDTIATTEPNYTTFGVRPMLAHFLEGTDDEVPPGYGELAP